MKRRILSFWLILILILSIILFSCTNSDDEDDVSPFNKQTTSTFHMYTNPGDSLALSIDTPDADCIEFFAIKDQEGMTEQLTAVRVTDMWGDQTDIFLDEEYRPAWIISENGTSFHLQWDNDGQMSVTALSPEGGLSVSVPIDASSSGQVTSGNICSNCIAGIYPEPGPLMKGKLYDDNKDKNNDDIVTSAVPEGGWSGTTQVRVNVTHCGDPVTNATVYLYVSDKQHRDLNYNWICYPKSGSQGIYATTVPVKDNRPDIGNKLEPAIKSVAEKLGVACSVVTKLDMDAAMICGSIAAATDAAILGPTGEATQIMAACYTAMKAAVLYCYSLGAGADGGQTAAEYLANNMADSIDRSFSETIQYYAVVTAPGLGTKTSETKTVAVWELMPEINVDFDTIKAYANYRPSSPGPKDNYRMEVSIKCVPDGTPYTISVTGNDGYFDSKTGTTKIISGSEVKIFNDAMVSPGREINRETEVWKIIVNGTEVLQKVVKIKNPNDCPDADGDNFYAKSGCGTPVDCRDDDPDIFPGAMENCTDGKDNNCNGKTDCADDFCKNEPDCKTNGNSLTAIVDIQGIYSSNFKAETIAAFVPEGGWPYVYGRNSNGDELYFVIDSSLTAPMSSRSAKDIASLVYTTPQIKDTLSLEPVELSGESGNIELSYMGTAIGSRIKGMFTDVKIVGVQTVCEDTSCSKYHWETIKGNMTVNFDVTIGPEPSY